MRDAGFTYINVDDLWAEPDRDAAGNLVANQKKFPSGMKALAGKGIEPGRAHKEPYRNPKSRTRLPNLPFPDQRLPSSTPRPPRVHTDYVHQRGLKFGLYSDVGTKTCGGQPGSFGHECQDAKLFAEWGVDWLKEDHCNVPGGDPGLDGFYNSALGKMRDCLNGTGRAIFFDVCAHSCYDTKSLKHSPECWESWYGNATKLGNSWRTTTDINDSWKAVLNNWYRNDRFADTLGLAQFNGPNHWNDPDSLVVGMGGLTRDQERLHFSMWVS